MGPRVFSAFLKVLPLLLILSTGLLLPGCPPLPVFVGDGYLKSAVTGPDGRIHLVFEDAEGVKYGVINVMTLSSELVTAEGTLGGMGNNYRGMLALDPQGRPHVLYYSSDNLVHAWKQTGIWASEVVATMSSCVASLPSMTIDNSGHVHMSYAYSDCQSTQYEIRYARRDEGGWSEELVTIDDGNYWMYPLVASRIDLGPDQVPVIAVATSGLAFEPHCSDVYLRVAEPMEEGGWQVEEVLYVDDPCIENGESNGIDDLSLAVGPSGEKALGFILSSASKYGSSSYYRIMLGDGTGWVTEEMCGRWCSAYESPCLVDGRFQDIAYNQAGQLFSTFTRERIIGGYGSESVKESIALARRTVSGWQEETLWYNTLYDAQIARFTLPFLLLTQTSKVRILYNTPGEPTDRLALLSEWF